MIDHDRGTLADPDATPERIRRAWEFAVLTAMTAHRDADVPVTTWDWEHNRVIQVPAAQFLDQQADQEDRDPAPARLTNPDPARKTA